MSSAFNHKSRSRKTHSSNAEIFRGFERRSSFKKDMRDSKKKPSIIEKTLTSFKNLFRKNQGK